MRLRLDYLLSTLSSISIGCSKNSITKDNLSIFSEAQRRCLDIPAQTSANKNWKCILVNLSRRKSVSPRRNKRPLCGSTVAKGGRFLFSPSFPARTRMNRRKSAPSASARNKFPLCGSSLAEGGLFFLLPAAKTGYRRVSACQPPLCGYP